MASRIDFDFLPWSDLCEKDLLLIAPSRGAKILSAVSCPEDRLVYVFYDGDKNRGTARRVIQVVRTMGSTDGMPVNARFIDTIRVVGSLGIPLFVHLYDLGEAG